MRILIDTNVVLDYLGSREPFFSDAKDIFALCAAEDVEGFVAFHTLPNAYYILHHTNSDEVC